MSQGSKISWTDSSWNPVRGCDKVSDGCRHCYAQRFAERFRGVAGNGYEQGFDLSLVPHMLVAPLTWTRPQWVFVNSMSDVFHQDVPDDYIERVLRVMELTDWHVFQVLTKRSERLAKSLTGKFEHFAACPNILWGVTVEDRKNADRRIPDLKSIPVNGRRFLSAEPMLRDLGSILLDGIGWVIVGGESGPGARPMDKQWVRTVRDQCIAAGVKFYFKQWGGTRKKDGDKVLDGRTWEERPDFTAAPVPARLERLWRKGQVEADVANMFPDYVKGVIPVQTPSVMVV